VQIFRRPAVALIVGLVLSLVVLAAGYFLLIGPKKGDVSKKQKEVEAAQQKIQAEKVTFRELLNIKNNSAAYEAQLAALQEVIPQEAALPQLIRNIQAAADPGTGAGLPWLSFAPSDISTGENSKSYSTYTFSMRVGGFYDEVTDLVYRLERLPRAVTISGINITASTGFLERSFSQNLGVVQAEIQARTFTFASPPAAAGQASSSTPTPGSQPTSQGLSPSTTP
jgi:Tfp pilus assembly protein PilO